MVKIKQKGAKEQYMPVHIHVLVHNIEDIHIMNILSLQKS